MIDAINLIKQSKKIIAVSNYKFTSETEKYISSYDCIIRFNVGSNPSILTQSSYYNGRTDICGISGWGYSSGPYHGFVNKPILFTRPEYNIKLKGKYKFIYIQPKIIDNFSLYTTNLSYIPYTVFEDLDQIYNYDHPTSGLITIFYIKKYLNKNIDCLNFFVTEDLFNAFSNQAGAGHDIKKEKQILATLNLNDIKI